MSGWLLDTNVLSELRKADCDPRVSQMLAAIDLEDLYLCDLVLAEIRFGIELLPQSVHRTELETWLNDELRVSFSGRILAVDEDILVLWCLLSYRGKKAGRNYAPTDLLIAATLMQRIWYCSRETPRILRAWLFRCKILGRISESSLMV